MSTQKIEYRLLKEEEFDKVRKLMKEEFFTREPPAVAMKFSTEGGEAVYGDLTKAASSQNVSYGAFDNGELIGIHLCYLGRELKDSEFEDISELPIKIQQVMTIIITIFGGNVVETIGTKDYMQSFALCTKTGYTNRGIGTELFRLSEELAKQEGCKKIFTIGSSAFTQKITAKLGYENTKEIVYKDYVDPLTKTKVLENVEEPHTKMTLSVKDI